MDILANLALGFSIALTPQVLAYAFIGCLFGTLVGMLPGVGPLTGISLLLPVTYGLNPTIAIVMLAGVYYGAMYGGSTTSILMRIPGEAASVMTCIDGYAMTQKGRAGPALAIAAIGSFIAGTVSVVGLMLLAPPIAAVALKFGPPEYAALLTLGLLVLAYLSSGSTLKMLLMALVGLLVGLVGIDQMSGFARFTWNVPELADGVGVVPVAVGLFGISEIMLSARPSGALKVQKPRLALAIPSGAVPAVMLAALMIHGISPGPQLMQSRPDIFWGFIASMYVGNVVLLILNLPMVGLFVNLLRIPYAYLYPFILALCLLGVYSTNQSTVDVWIAIGFGVLGYFLRKLEFDTAPLVLGVILAPMLELAIRQSLAMSGGDWSIFAKRPIAGTMLALVAALVIYNLLSRGWRTRVGLEEK